MPPTGPEQRADFGPPFDLYDAGMSVDPVPLSAIEFSDNEVVPIKELTELYESVGWTAYAVDPDGLARAVDRSSSVVTARNEEGDLVGLARCLTDDVHVCLIQDVLVRPDHQRTGIGAVLVGRCLRVHEHVRQIQLISDDDPAVVAFHRSLGFVDGADHGLRHHIMPPSGSGAG